MGWSCAADSNSERFILALVSSNDFNHVRRGAAGTADFFFPPPTEGLIVNFAPVACEKISLLNRGWIVLFGIDCIAQRQLNSPSVAAKVSLGCVIGRDEQSNYGDCLWLPFLSCSTFWPAASTRTFSRIVRVISPCAAFWPITLP